ncbi:hypothetical protein SAMN05428969_0810 [Devosia sp. YR412]|uniref:hypothetical protein n=1 Tax=Devosia sp. YR412 TaxID=1881030 RepID=UPI0008C11447|nr:hypothetical protein [Devosia sp. YR412]SEP76542.1 hypothetical protein SAMN05428969_0810 [Devosia sp. YR412]
MSQAATQSDTSLTRRTGRTIVRPFAGALDLVLVQDPLQFSFPGSISRSHAEAAWTWAARDLAPELIDAERLADGSYTSAELEAIMPEMLLRMKAGIETAAADPEKDRRLRATLGSLEARDALPGIVLALRSRALLGKAQAFGKAINAMTDDAAIGAALQSMPLKDPALSALLFHAALPQIANPTRLATAIIKLSGNATEAAVIRMGFTPIIEAILAHAQNQLFVLQPMGPFADIDLICRSLDRFHRLVRSLTGYIEFARGSRWAMILSAVTKQVSDRIEPRLRDVVSDINQSLRKGREGSDRLDNDRILAAINGMYLLVTIRECRDSLALNALFDQAWSQSGEALELHVQRNLDLIRQNPSDSNTGARLDAGIKMAEVRFNPEYAETLKRARAAAERRG